MPARRVHPQERASRLAGLALLLPLALSAACGKNGEQRLQALIPDVDPELVTLLARQDEAGLADYSRRQGRVVLADAFAAIELAVRAEPLDLFARRRAFALPYLGLLARRMSEDYGSPHYSQYYLYRTKLSPEEDFRREQLWIEMERILAASCSTGERIDRLLKIVDQLKKMDDKRGVFYAENHLIGLYDRAGDPRGDQALLSSLELARRLEYPLQVCQLLGTLGYRYQRLGKVDSMLACWDEAEELATRTHLGEQVARIFMFRARYFEKQGYFALAEDLHEEAQDRCRALGGGSFEPRYFLSSLSFTARLGAWNRFQQHLSRARSLIQEFKDSATLPSARLRWFETDVSLLEADYLMAQGRVDEAQAIYRELKPALSQDPTRVDPCRLLCKWSMGLIENGRPAEALPIALEAARLVRDHHLDQYCEAFLEIAEAELQLKAPDAADRALREFKKRTKDDVAIPLRVWRDALDARLALARGDRRRSAKILERSLQDLLTITERMEASEHLHLYLNGCQELRLSIQALAGSDPLRSYRLDLEWRRLLALMGFRGSEWTRLNRAQALEGIAARLRDPGGDPAGYPPGRSDAPGAPTAGQEHWMYLVRRDGIIRWTVSASGVTRDSLAISGQWLRDRIEGAVEGLTRHSTGPIPEDLEASLETLAQALVPPSARAELRNGAPLLISPDGCLDGFPFEVLDLDPGPDYMPLLARRDVAYLRFDAEALPSDESPASAVVIADPDLAPEIRRRHPRLESLAGGREEGAAAAQLIPSTTVLEGPSATKEEILSRWESAHLIYFAAHVIHDPDAPFKSFVPLAAPHGRDRHPEDAYLGMIDVRRADLHRCNMVVLSACASGTPYVSYGRVAPSLADAFLDAGAAAVIQTFWDVRDQDAAALMHRFLDLWRRTPEDPVHAFCEARRERMRGPAGVLHPSTWGNQSIKLGRRSPPPA